MKTRKGIYYFATPASAREWATANGWPTDRIIEYTTGHAVQAGIGGNYAGPGKAPRPYFTPAPQGRQEKNG